MVYNDVVSVLVRFSVLRPSGPGKKNEEKEPFGFEVALQKTDFR